MSEQYCPYCNGPLECEYTEIRGEQIQCSPKVCDNCGAVEIAGYTIGRGEVIMSYNPIDASKEETEKEFYAPTHDKWHVIWRMPDWMKKHEEAITNTGGNDVTELMNGHDDPMINIALSTIQAMCKAQVALLEQLHKAGLLK